jgi:FHA domain-containing protein/uncharacterized protein DUF1707
LAKHWSGAARAPIVGYVVSKDTVPPVLRVSDEDRDHVIEILRHGSEEGRLSSETFVQRVEIALQARGAAELAALLSDLPAREPDRNWLVRAAGWFSDLGHRMRQSWRSRRLQQLILPRGDRPFIIGRSPECDLTLNDTTVSWRHAELRWTAGVWMLADLGSTNGTHVNGWRAGQGFAIRPGDRVRMGTVTFVVTD